MSGDGLIPQKNTRKMSSTEFCRVTKDKIKVRNMTEFEVLRCLTWQCFLSPVAYVGSPSTVAPASALGPTASAISVRYQLLGKRRVERLCSRRVRLAL